MSLAEPTLMPEQRELLRTALVAAHGVQRALWAANAADDTPVARRAKASLMDALGPHAEAFASADFPLLLEFLEPAPPMSDADLAGWLRVIARMNPGVVNVPAAQMRLLDAADRLALRPPDPDAPPVLSGLPELHPGMTTVVVEGGLSFGQDLSVARAQMRSRCVAALVGPEGAADQQVLEATAETDGPFGASTYHLFFLPDFAHGVQFAEQRRPQAALWAKLTGPQLVGHFRLSRYAQDYALPAASREWVWR